MNLQCKLELRGNYTSAAQIARVLSEEWCRRELYCAACESDRLSSSKANTPAVDLVCPDCTQTYQLKSFRTWNQKKIVDAAYDSMVRAIRSDRVPNLLVMQYSADWLVSNLLVVPGTFFVETVIEKRPPLSSTAKRAGWIGCNILLERIPVDGKIAIVADGSSIPVRQVRREFSRSRRLAVVPPALRGWTLDVLNAIRNLGRLNFSLQDLYKFEANLKQLHPRNQNVRPKMRQQLQVLRDLGIIEFTRLGNYSLLA